MTTQRIDELLHMFNETAPIAQTVGMTLSYDDEARAIVDMPYNPDMDHALEGIHGGVYATLLDTAGWFTAAAAYDESCWLPPRCRSTFWRRCSRAGCARLDA